MYDNGLIFPVLIRFIYGCGLRLSEATNLKASDINLETGEITILHSKNDKSRTVFASASLLSVIRDYIPRLHAYEGEGHLFRGAAGRQYSKLAADRMMVKTRSLAGLDGNGHQPLRIHDLRHNFAVRAMEKMLDGGMDLYACMPLLSMYMGHRSLRETEYYIRLTNRSYSRITEKTDSIAEDIFPKLEAD
ncbi:MAG: tyrosine-type recombinase/integrase [Eggerthellales bacterium]|nr:tyrosine-type recombinase/integrase [Eggerthellales bacterium]